MRVASYVAGLVWFQTMCDDDHWGLSEEQASFLLGVSDAQTYKAFVKQVMGNKLIEINDNVEERLSLLLGIHRAIQMTSPKGNEHKFFNTPIDTEPFNGASAKSFLLMNAEISDFIQVKRYFETKCY